MGKIFLTLILAIIFLMGKYIVTEIRDNYPLYTDLYDNGKTIAISLVQINITKPNNSRYIVSSPADLKHITLTHPINLVAEVKISNHKYFHFVVSCEVLSKVPFFRYDSDGPTHRNYDTSLSLVEQQITTPHFHKFNSEGISIAFKTSQLLDAITNIQLEDIANCIVHFCNVGNIKTSQGGSPGVAIMPAKLQLTIIQDDPTAGVNFI